ncbi:MAG: YbaB/EbfC family nucleoid-associated protein [Clostridiales bacterium]|nr:YbaB/EbfC family nucleoid-associated protein [Clostridiales bacterium]
MKARLPQGMGGGPSNMQGMMKQVQKMQEQMTELQEDLDAREYDVNAGGGAVSVKINGKKEILSISIKPEIVDPDDIETLSDVLVAAVNEAIRKVEELKKSRRIAAVWVVISLFAAVAIGVIGRALMPAEEALLSAGGAENVFVLMAQKLLPAILAGAVMAGILAATISSSDSYLLIAASAVSKNIFKGILKKDASDKTVMWVSRIVLIAVAVIGAVIALDENSVIFTLVSFAWAGFGATFGPVILFSLFWKRMNRAGALAGMLTGGVSVFVWKLALKPLGGLFGIYELLPAFLLACIAIITVSLLSKKPSSEIEAEFEQAKATQN